MSVFNWKKSSFSFKNVIKSIFYVLLSLRVIRSFSENCQTTYSHRSKFINEFIATEWQTAGVGRQQGGTLYWKMRQYRWPFRVGEEDGWVRQYAQNEWKWKGKNQ